MKEQNGKLSRDEFLSFVKAVLKKIVGRKQTALF